MTVPGSPSAAATEATHLTPSSTATAATATHKSGLYRNDVFVVNLDDGSVALVTRKADAGAVQISYPAYSPDGSAIAFAGWASSLASVGSDIYRIPADGSAKAVNLTASSPDIHYLPRWRR